MFADPIDIRDWPIATIDARIREIVGLPEMPREIQRPFHNKGRYLDFDDDRLHSALLRCTGRVPAATPHARKEQLREARIEYPKMMTLFEMIAPHIPGDYKAIDVFNSPGNGITYITECNDTEVMMTILGHIASIYPDRYRKRFYHIKRKPAEIGEYCRENVIAIVISE